LALKLKDKECWAALSKEAMRQLDIDLSINVYRQMGDAAMVLALEKILAIEEKNLLAGHIALLFGEYDTAEVCYRLTSSYYF
jgi:WD repeat-containing protein 19